MSIILKQTQEIQARLSKFGFEPADLISVLDAAKGGAAIPNDDFAPTARGTYAYHEAVAELRRVGRRHGYVRNNEKNVPSIVNSDLGIRIVLTSTDEVTGLDLGDRIPKRRNDLGSTHQGNIASTVRQLSLLDVLESEQDAALKLVELPTRGILTYFLCYYWWVDGEGEFKVRGELSFCNKVNENNFESFRERALLVPEAFNITPGPAPDETDYEISVEPLAG